MRFSTRPYFRASAQSLSVCMTFDCAINEVKSVANGCTRRSTGGRRAETPRNGGTAWQRRERVVGKSRPVARAPGVRRLARAPAARRRLARAPAARRRASAARAHDVTPSGVTSGESRRHAPAFSFPSVSGRSAPGPARVSGARAGREEFRRAPPRGRIRFPSPDSSSDSLRSRIPRPPR